MIYIFMLVGFALLIFGGDVVVKGGVGLAKNLGLPKAVIGLTIIAYGTSAPELVVSLESALTGHGDMALGNVIGSNLSNILLILGVTALIYPIVCDKKLLKPDGILMLVVTAMLVIFCLDGVIAHWEGLVFLTMVLGYTWYTFAQGRKQGFEELEAEMEEDLEVELPLPKSLLYVAIGITMMVGGGKLLVDGAVQMAQILGVSEAVIGLTILAIGTSLPELATSVAAARRQHADIAVANVIGSNLLNIFGIIGITALIEPLSVATQFMSLDLWILLVITALLAAMLFSGSRLNRPMGVVFSLGFVAYIAYQYQSVML